MSLCATAHGHMSRKACLYATEVWGRDRKRFQVAEFSPLKTNGVSCLVYLSFGKSRHSLVQVMGWGSTT